MRNTTIASVEEAQKRVHQVSLLLPLSSISDSWLRLSVLGSLPAPYLVDSVPASFFLVVYHTSMSWCRKKDEHSVLLCSTVLLRIRVGRASKGSLLARQRAASTFIPYFGIDLAPLQKCPLLTFCCVVILRNANGSFMYSVPMLDVRKAQKRTCDHWALF